MIEKSAILPGTPAEVFARFTQRASRWWPADRRHTGDPTSRIVFEDGLLVETARDGRRVVLARVLAWEPPGRILLDFYVATGPEQPTAAEILFEAVADGTRITVRHGPKPESAALWSERAPRYAGSWERLLAALALDATEARL